MDPLQPDLPAIPDNQGVEEEAGGLVDVAPGEHRAELDPPRAYYLFAAGSQLGPYSKEEIIQYHGEGQVTATHLVYDDAHGEWIPLLSHPDFIHLGAHQTPIAGPVSASANVVNAAPLMDSDQSTVGARAHSTRRLSRRLAFTAGAIFLMVAIAMAIAYGYLERRPVAPDLALLFPNDARSFVSCDARAMDAVRLRTLAEYLAWIGNPGGLDVQLPPAEKLTGRYALATYGSERAGRQLSASLLVVEAPAPSLDLLVSRTLSKIPRAESTVRQLEGWNIEEVRLGGDIYLGAARSGNIQIFSTAPALLDEAILLEKSGGGGSLGASERYRAAFDLLGGRRSLRARLAPLAGSATSTGERIFLDLRRMAQDNKPDPHTIYSDRPLLPGDAWRFLSQFELFAASGEGEGADHHWSGLARFIAAPPWLGRLKDARATWNRSDQTRPGFGVDVALPENWLADVGEGFTENVLGTKMTIARTVVKGAMAQINPALVAYFGDHASLAVGADVPVDSYLVSPYLGSALMTPWGEPYRFSGDSTGYTVTASLRGEPLFRYTSRGGQIVESPNAAQRIAGLDSVGSDSSEALFSKVSEVIVLGPADVPGSSLVRWFLRRSHSLGTLAGLMALRSRDADQLEALGRVVLGSCFGGDPMQSKVEAPWVVVADPPHLNAYVFSDSKPADGDGFLRFWLNLDLSKELLPEASAGIPASHLLSLRGVAKVDGEAIFLDINASPDPMPIAIGSFLGSLYAPPSDHYPH